MQDKDLLTLTFLQMSAAIKNLKSYSSPLSNTSPYSHVLLELGQQCLLVLLVISLHCPRKTPEGRSGVTLEIYMICKIDLPSFL